MLKALNCFGRSLLVFNSLLLLSTSSTTAQTLPPPPTAQDVYQFNAPNHPNSQTLFRVQIYGNSEQLLSLVRRVEPDAFVPEGKNIIQAGLFSDAINARELVQSLSEQGITADIIEVAKPRNVSSQANPSSREYISLSTPTETETSVRDHQNSVPEKPEFIPLAVETTPPTPEAERKTSTRSYYVVIPTREKNLSETAQAVAAAGVNQDLIWERNAPRGTHVAVGPFSHRAQASRWSSQLETEGLNARVYFGP
ncbi:hypothetical protein PCC7418_2339 [Halothece sp. PCC 7418]|uniref:SPOR domain-containing protein n=1 Tax=Halothece sp. (strain PCC 7418) TaxID=65093 RepID=UPI0002A0800F|nr:hypothetical protein [Halothece sp. PCC 7418]AFZ44488.1 hypothetical protein PCC7418_2339 [Halothece sp. PCC 7418]